MGRFVEDEIRKSIDSSAYFVTQGAARPWQLVGDFDKLDDDVVTEALTLMEDQFTKRQIFESGELLHVVALKMMMACRKVTTATVTDVKNAAIEYIDDQLRQNLLPPRPAGHEWYNSFDGSWAGVSYWVVEEYRDEFQAVFNYLIESRSKSLDRLLPELAQPLLEVVRTNGQRFFEKVCYTRNASIEFEDVPILAHVVPKDFVDAWLASPKTGWYWIGKALKERAKAAPQYPSLQTEIAWYPKVVTEMQARAQATTGLAKLRIERAASMVGLPKTPSRKHKTEAPAVPPSGL